MISFSGDFQRNYLKSTFIYYTKYGIYLYEI